MLKYLLSTFVLIFALTTAMAQSNESDTSKKETTTVSKDAGTTQDATATPATKVQKCASGSKAKCCAKKKAKGCAPGCVKTCCSKAEAGHKHKPGEKHACAPGCTKDCCS
jgi:hypothetical protein